MSEAPIERFVTALIAAGSIGKHGRWTCPAHNDHEPSLSVATVTAQNAKKQDHVGSVLFYCHAGCSKEAVLTALGLELSDLFPNSDYRTYSTTQPVTYTYSRTLTTYSRRLKLADLEALCERDGIEPVDVGLSPPDRLGVTARLVLADMARLMGLFCATGEGRPMPYATTTCAERMGWSGAAGQRRASRTICALEKTGVIRCTETTSPRGALKGTKCYEPVGVKLAELAVLPKQNLAEFDSQLELSPLGGSTGEPVLADPLDAIESGAVVIERADPHPLREAGDVGIAFGVTELDEVQRVDSAKRTPDSDDRLPACGHTRQWRVDDPFEAPGPWRCFECDRAWHERPEELIACRDLSGAVAHA